MILNRSCQCVIWNRVSVSVTVEWRVCFPGRRFFSSSESTEMITSAEMEGSCLSENQHLHFSSWFCCCCDVTLDVSHSWMWFSTLHSSSLLFYLLAVISVLKRFFKLKGPSVENLKWVEIMNGHTCFSGPESAYQHPDEFFSFVVCGLCLVSFAVDPNNTLQVFLCSHFGYNCVYSFLLGL